MVKQIFTLAHRGILSPKTKADELSFSAFRRPLCQVWIISPAQFVFPVLLLSVPHMYCKLHHTPERSYSCPPCIVFGAPDLGAVDMFNIRNAGGFEGIGEGQNVYK